MKKIFKNPYLNIAIVSFIAILLFFGLGYLLAPNKHSFLTNKNWLYQLAWFPLHTLLAYWSIVIFKRGIEEKEYKRIRTFQLLSDFKKYKKINTISLLIATPFIIEDIIEGLESFNLYFSDLGYSSLIMIGPVWFIEWLALGVIWTRVIFLAVTTLQRYNTRYVSKNLFSILNNPSANPILVAGEKNALLNLIYGLSSLGYIFFCGGEKSDFQTVTISALLVLTSFLTSFFAIRIQIEKALERIADLHEKRLSSFYLNASSRQFEHLSFKPELLESLLFGEVKNFNARAHERVNAVKASLFFESALIKNKPEFIFPNAVTALQFIQYEINLSKFGNQQLHGTLFRLAAVLFAFFDKFPFLSKLM